MNPSARKNPVLSRRFIQSCCLILVLSLLSCAVGGGDDDDDEANNSQREDVFTLNATTNERGVAEISFALPEGSTKFGITARVPDDEVSVRFTDILSGDGTNYLDPGRGVQISLADTFSRFVNAATAPSRDVDPPLNSTDRFTVRAEASSASETLIGETITFQINSKVDPGLGGGRMRVNVFFVGDVGAEQGTKDVVHAAMSGMSSIYSQAGINIEFEEIDIDGPVVLPTPTEGDKFYLDASGSAVSPAVNIFISGDISGFGSQQVLGVSSSIPGPFHPTERSAVAVSIFVGAGADGIYSSEDVRILGETLAHESGHFMGLFHPVDFGGGTVAATDPLDDTQTCSFVTECLSDPDLINNLMFSSPVADGQGGFVQQNELTDQQRAVLNRYIVVD